LRLPPVAKFSCEEDNRKKITDWKENQAAKMRLATFFNL
jgi:hypothetical protein